MSRLDPSPGSFVDRQVALPGAGTVRVRVRRPTAPGTAPAAPVMLLHGLGSNATIWDAVAWRLAESGRPVAALDLPGHGDSGPPEVGYTWPVLTAAVVAVIRALGWDEGPPPVLVGHHLGGNLAVEVAVTHPGLVAALVLVDGGTLELAARFADWPTCAVAMAPTIVAGADGARHARMLRAVHADWPADSLAGALADAAWLPDGTIEPRLRQQDHQALLRLLWDHHPHAGLASLTVPVTMVAPGTPRDRSASAGREEMEAAARLMPSATLRWVSGDSELHAQDPETIAGLIVATA